MKDFEKNITNALHACAPKARREAYLHTVRVARGEWVKRKYHTKIGFWGFFARQLKFLSIPICISQGAALAVMLLLLDGGYGTMYFENERNILCLLCGYAVLVMFTAIPFLTRAVRFGMYETESASLFSARRILTARLLTIGLGDGAMLSCIFLFTLLKTPLSAFHIALYMMLPFFILSSAALWMLKRLDAGRRFTGCCVGAGMALFLFAFLKSRLFADAVWADSPWMIAILAALALCLARQIWNILNSEQTIGGKNGIIY